MRKSLKGLILVYLSFVSFYAVAASDKEILQEVRDFATSFQKDKEDQFGDLARHMREINATKHTFVDLQFFFDNTNNRYNDFRTGLCQYLTSGKLKIDPEEARIIVTNMFNYSEEFSQWFDKTYQLKKFVPDAIKLIYLDTIDPGLKSELDKVFGLVGLFSSSLYEITMNDISWNVMIPEWSGYNVLRLGEKIQNIKKSIEESKQLSEDEKERALIVLKTLSDFSAKLSPGLRQISQEVLDYKNQNPTVELICASEAIDGTIKLLTPKATEIGKTLSTTPFNVRPFFYAYVLGKRWGGLTKTPKDDKQNIVVVKDDKQKGVSIKKTNAISNALEAVNKAITERQGIVNDETAMTFTGIAAVHFPALNYGLKQLLPNLEDIHNVSLKDIREWLKTSKALLDENKVEISDVSVALYNVESRPRDVTLSPEVGINQYDLLLHTYMLVRGIYEANGDATLPLMLFSALADQKNRCPFGMVSRMFIMVYKPAYDSICK